jgi:SAM-dependent methyltransferase
MNSNTFGSQLMNPPRAGKAKPQSDPQTSKRVLNAGCGAYATTALHAAFRNPAWTETRLDLDEGVRPDILGSVTDLKQIPDGAFDAVWCSHSLEHLYRHDVVKALAEFQRVLKPDGFTLITSPDLESIAELVVSGRLEEVAYKSPARRPSNGAICSWRITPASRRKELDACWSTAALSRCW